MMMAIFGLFLRLLSFVVMYIISNPKSVTLEPARIEAEDKKKSTKQTP